MLRGSRPFISGLILLLTMTAGRAQEASRTDQPLPDTLQVELQQGEQKFYYLRIANPDSAPIRWQVALKPENDMVSFSAASGVLSPGERCDLRFAVSGKRLGDHSNAIAVRTTSRMLRDRLISVHIIVRSNPATRTMFVLSRSRLFRFFPDSAEKVIASINKLAGDYDVQGVVVDIDSSAAALKAYQEWDQGDNWQSIAHANRAALAIDRYLEDNLLLYPAVIYLILVGDDRIIPFFRIKDKSTRVFQERNYVRYKPSFTCGAAVDSNYILTNELYADREEEFSATYLSVPFEYIVSRLVKSPTQIIRQVDAFLENGPEISIHDVFVSSGDYSDSSATFDLKDCADSIVRLYGRSFGHGSVHSQLIQNKEIRANYDIDDFTRVVLRRKFDLYSINNHAYHTGFFMPQHDMLRVARLVRDLPRLNRAIIHTVGCHTGMTTTGPENEGWDFPSLFAQKGAAAYIGNTAYSIGSALGVNRSERLQVHIAAHLGRGEPVGDALRNAKHDYWATRNPGENNPYDDLKVVLPISLFGLPYYRCVDHDWRFDVAGLPAVPDRQP